MRSFYISVFFLTFAVSQSAKAQTFVEACLAGTEVLTKTLQCKIQNTTFTLDKGLKIQVISQKGSQKMFDVKKIKHLPDRITALGLQPHSIQFISQQNNLTATVSIPCGQSAYAYVGLGAEKDGLPYEAVAECRTY